ncbi:MAG: TlyA family RNA methyltransferase, partial [Nannocystaceae bacterium]
VVVDDHAVDKPGTMVSKDATVRLKRGHEGVLPYVSRGGLKLRGALDTFSALSVEGRVAMDVGASTGGFTDCLLQAGASRVFAVDVGYGQLAWKLNQDPRVVVLDRENIRTLEPQKVSDPVSLVVMDCSFISLRKILAPLPKFLGQEADVVALVKPQFEVGREGVGKGGIVRDPALRQRAQDDVVEAASALGFTLRGRCTSPILGREGNEESFVWLGWGTLPMLGDA